MSLSIMTTTSTCCKAWVRLPLYKPIKRVPTPVFHRITVVVAARRIGVVAVHLLLVAVADTVVIAQAVADAKHTLSIRTQLPEHFISFAKEK